jgi:tRNA G18 (ribose-2'-O)-methylase SpoU
MTNETRNIINHYWYWETEAIKTNLDTKRHPFSVLCSNLYNDFNVACVIRSANAFLASKIFVYGRKKYDKRGTVGTHHYEHIEFLKEEESLDELLGNFNLVAFDNVDGAEPLPNFQWPERTLMAFGQEQVGLPPEILSRAKSVVYIPQYGSVRSLNVASAASIAMYDWCVKNGQHK